MSGLRAALEELATQWELAEFPSKATELRTILAAHPVDSKVEWSMSELEGRVTWAEDSEQEAREVARRRGYELVFRQVTEWQVAK